MKIEDILAALPSKDDIATTIGLQARPSTSADALASFGLLGAGMILGAGLALLFAPKAGHEIRQDIVEKVAEISDQLRVAAQPPTTSTNGPNV